MASRANTIAPVIFPSQSYAVGTWFGGTGGQARPTTAAGARVAARNDAWAGALFVIDVTAVGGAGTVTIQLAGYDPVSAKFYNIPGAVTAAIAAISTVTLLIFPGTIETANGRVSYVVPPLYDLVATVAGNAVTFSMNGWLLGY